MALITVPQQIFLWEGASTPLSPGFLPQNVRAIYRLNQTGTAWASYQQGSTYSAITSLEPGFFYYVVSLSLNYDLPGANTGMGAPVSLTVGLNDLAPEVRTLLQAGGTYSLTPNAGFDAIAP